MATDGMDSGATARDGIHQIGIHRAFPSSATATVQRQRQRQRQQQQQKQQQQRQHALQSTGACPAQLQHHGPLLKPSQHLPSSPPPPPSATMGSSSMSEQLASMQRQQQMLGIKPALWNAIVPANFAQQLSRTPVSAGTGQSAQPTAAVSTAALAAALEQAMATSLVQLKRLFLRQQYVVLTTEQLRASGVIQLTRPTVVVSPNNLEAVLMPGALLPDGDTDEDGIIELQQLLADLRVIWTGGSNVCRSVSEADIVMVGFRAPQGGPSVTGSYHAGVEVHDAGQRVARSMYKAMSKYVSMDKCHTVFTDMSTIDSVKTIKGHTETSRLPSIEPRIGGAPATALSVTRWYESCSHKDSGDGPWSIIGWLHDGGPVGCPGMFHLGPRRFCRENPSGACFRPAHGDLLFINTQVLWHHTELPAGVTSGRAKHLGEEPAVFGMALVYKPSAVKAIAKHLLGARQQLFALKAEKKQVKLQRQQQQEEQQQLDARRQQMQEQQRRIDAGQQRLKVQQRLMKAQKQQMRVKEKRLEAWERRLEAQQQQQQMREAGQQLVKRPHCSRAPSQ